MLREIPWTIITLVFGAICISGVAAYYFMDYRQNTIDQGITETAESALFANRDNISRLNEGELFINRAGFEADFTNNIAKNINFNEAVENIHFEYLTFPNGAIKAVRVKMDVHDKPYQATYKVNISNL